MLPHESRLLDSLYQDPVKHSALVCMLDKSYLSEDKLKIYVNNMSGRMSLSVKRLKKCSYGPNTSKTRYIFIELRSVRKRVISYFQILFFPIIDCTTLNIEYEYVLYSSYCTTLLSMATMVISDHVDITMTSWVEKYNRTIPSKYVLKPWLDNEP